MQIRLSPEAAAAAKHDGRMTVDEFLARFPEVPSDLKDEPVLAQYVDAFGLLLREARKPTPCMGTEGGDAGHRFYTALVNDLAIYGIGLSKRDRTLARLAKRLEDYRKQPATYACTLVPHRTPDTPRTGCQA
ncbi:MAG TPA: hypothetical protein VMQ51_19585 [Candidatus Binatia bacterium]|nr:hypothetical protein [Candidatus Binatia bacterium]